VTAYASKAGGATQTDFVASITNNNLPAHFWSNVKSDGTDIILTLANGTKLKRQVAYINTVTEVMEIYVRIPSYSHEADTVVYLYYGNAAGAETNDADTWPATWVFVSDMSDYNSGTQIRDWSQYGNHGTKGAAYASLAANLSNGTGTLSVNPTSIAAGNDGTVVTVTGAGTFTITIPANQCLGVVKGTVTSVAINVPTAGARTITVVGTGTFTATWAVTAAPTEVAGLVGMAQQFVAANNQLVSFGDNPLFEPVNITVIALAASADGNVVNWATPFAKGNQGTNKHWWLHATATGMRFEAGNGVSRSTPSVNAVFGTDYHYWAGTYDGTTAFLYWNDVVSAPATTISGDLVGDHYPMRAGAASYTSLYYWNGPICELRLSSSALGAELQAAIDNWLRNNADCYEVGAVVERSSLTLGAAATASRALAYGRTASHGLGLGVVVSRAMAYLRTATHGLGLAVSISKAFPDKAASFGMGLAASVSRALGYNRTATNGIGRAATVSRAVSYLRTSTLGVGMAATVTRAVAILRTATLGLGAAASALRQQALNYSATLGMGFSLTAKLETFWKVVVKGVVKRLYSVKATVKRLYEIRPRGKV
jgi:hypothetical protein